MVVYCKYNYASLWQLYDEERTSAEQLQLELVNVRRELTDTQSELSRLRNLSSSVNTADLSNERRVGMMSCVFLLTSDVVVVDDVVTMVRHC